jgi:hypothetical protein
MGTNLMGQATGFQCACTFVVSQDLIETLTSPGVLPGPIQEGLSSSI